MKFYKGQRPWNKGLSGIHLSPATEFKKGRIAPNKTAGIVKTCRCGNIFRVKPSLARVQACSHSCSRKGQPSAKKGIPLTEAQKLKISIAHKSWKQRHPNTPHWNYMLDRLKVRKSEAHKYDTTYKIWMKEVKQRDQWQCQLANQDCHGPVEAHHILPWSQFPQSRYNINNGITLCRRHHPRRRTDEIRFAASFMNLVANANAQFWPIM